MSGIVTDTEESDPVSSKIPIKHTTHRIKLIQSERNDSKYNSYYESVIITDTEERDQSPARDINNTQATHRIHLD